VVNIPSEALPDPVAIIGHDGGVARMNGWKGRLLGLLQRHPEVSEEVENSSALRGATIVILATSEFDDGLQSDEVQADSYIAGPVDHNEFLKSMETVDSFWMSLVNSSQEQVYDGTPLQN
jgi:hypothetical protein